MREGYKVTLKGRERAESVGGVMNNLTIDCTLEGQAKRFGVSLEQMRAGLRRNAEGFVQMAAKARELEAMGKRHRSGLTAAQLEESAVAYFAKAEGVL